MLLRLEEEPAELTEAEFAFIEARVGGQHFSFDVRVTSRTLSHLLEILQAPRHEIVRRTERLARWSPLGFSSRTRSFRRCFGLLQSCIPTRGAVVTTRLPASRRPRQPPSSHGRPAPLLWFFGGSRIVGPFPLGARANLVLPIFELVEPDKTSVRSFADEFRKLAEAEIPFTEPSVELQHHLFEAVRPHDVAPRGHAAHRPLHEIPRVVSLTGDLGRLSKPGETRVRIVLVTVLNQDVRAGLLDSYTDHILSVFLELEDQARKVRVTGEQNIRTDFRSDEDQLHPVDRHPDVGRVLLRTPVGGSEDQIDRRLGERDDILRITPPVGISPLDGHLSADDVGL